MKKYDKNVITQYLKNELSPTIRKDLENDVDFMVTIIKLTNEKKFYFLSSNLVKETYDFVKFLVLKFKYDINFIIYISDYYLSKNYENDVQDYKEIELIILVCSLLEKDPMKKIYENYFLERNQICDYILQSIDDIQNDINDKKKNMGLGFYYILCLFDNSNIILDYFAKLFIDKIFYGSNFNIEVEIHRSFNTFQELENKGLNKYILNIIDKYDKSLSDYIKNNLSLLDDIKKKFKKIQSDWEIFNPEFEIIKNDSKNESKIIKFNAFKKNGYDTN